MLNELMTAGTLGGLMALGGGTWHYLRSTGAALNYMFTKREDDEADVARKYIDRNSAADVRAMLGEVENHYRARQVAASTSPVMWSPHRRDVERFYDSRIEGLKAYQSMDPAEAHELFMSQVGVTEGRPSAVSGQRTVEPAAAEA